jgi:hypothetical protein
MATLYMACAKKCSNATMTNVGTEAGLVTLKCCMKKLAATAPIWAGDQAFAYSPSPRNPMLVVRAIHFSPTDVHLRTEATGTLASSNWDKLTEYGDC